MTQIINNTSTKRIAVVEDDPNLLDHFIGIISGVVDLDLAGVASSLQGARELFKLRPDLFLIDIGLPDGSGLDLVPEIKEGNGRQGVDRNIVRGSPDCGKRDPRRCRWLSGQGQRSRRPD